MTGALGRARSVYLWTNLDADAPKLTWSAAPNARTHNASSGGSRQNLIRRDSARDPAGSRGTTRGRIGRTRSFHGAGSRRATPSIGTHGAPAPKHGDSIRVRRSPMS